MRPPVRKRPKSSESLTHPQNWKKVSLPPPGQDPTLKLIQICSANSWSYKAEEKYEHNPVPGWVATIQILTGSSGLRFPKFTAQIVRTRSEMVRTGKEIKAGRRECALKAVQFLVQQHMMPWTATQPIRAIEEFCATSWPRNDLSRSERVALFPSLIPAMSYYPMNYTTQSYGMDQANEYKQPNDNSQAHNYDYEDDYVPSDDQADSGDQGSDGGAPVGLGRPGSSGDQQDGNKSPYFRPYCGSLTMSDLGRRFPDYSFERYGY